MTNIAQETITYVTHNDLDNLRQDVGTRLDDFQRQLQEAIRVTNEAVKAAKADSLENVSKLVDEKLQHEREQRRSEIGALRDEIKELGRDTRDTLNGIDSKLAEAMRGISSITGTLDGIKTSVDAREEKLNEVTRRLDTRIDEQAVKVNGLQSDVDLITSAQVDSSGKIRQLTNTVHGNPDNKDDAPSLFSILGDLKTQMEQGFSTVTTNYNNLQLAMNDNAQAITALREEREREKEIWAQRLKVITGIGGFVKKALDSKMGIAVITAIGGAIIAYFFPELKESVVNYIQSNLSGG